jgi:antitoxin HigA-1
LRAAGQRKIVPLAIHPGAYLKETLDELGVSQMAFARIVGISAMRVSRVVEGARPVTAELGLLLGKALDEPPEYWLNLQRAHDLAGARSAIGRRLGAIRRLAGSRNMPRTG